MPNFLHLLSCIIQKLRDWLLIVGVAWLVAIDVTIIATYLIVEGARGKLGAKLVPLGESLEGVSRVNQFSRKPK